MLHRYWLCCLSSEILEIFSLESFKVKQYIYVILGNL